jgi:predicted nucleotidyltransferase
VKRLWDFDSPEYNSVMDRNVLLMYVKEAVAQVEPEAQVILYGSRARGGWTAESDWDFLVLVAGFATDERVDRIRHRLYEIEWEFGQILSSIVRSRDEWNSRPLNTTPFHRSVSHEGIVL